MASNKESEGEERSLEWGQNEDGGSFPQLVIRQQKMRSRVFDVDFRWGFEADKKRFPDSPRPFHFSCHFSSSSSLFLRVWKHLLIRSFREEIEVKADNTRLNGRRRTSNLEISLQPGSVFSSTPISRHFLGGKGALCRVVQTLPQLQTS